MYSWPTFASKLFVNNLFIVVIAFTYGMAYDDDDDSQHLPIDTVLSTILPKGVDLDPIFFGLGCISVTASCEVDVMPLLFPLSLTFVSLDLHYLNLSYPLNMIKHIPTLNQNKKPQTMICDVFSQWKSLVDHKPFFVKPESA